jgi:hypothetical protein
MDVKGTAKLIQFTIGRFQIPDYLPKDPTPGVDPKDPTPVPSPKREGNFVTLDTKNGKMVRWQNGKKSGQADQEEVLITCLRQAGELNTK